MYMSSNLLLHTHPAIGFCFVSTTTAQVGAAGHTCAFVLFLILKSPSRSVPEGCLQQGLENCPYGFAGAARYTVPWAAPEARVRYKLDQTTWSMTLTAERQNLAFPQEGHID